MANQDFPYSSFGTESRVIFFTGAGISAESGIRTFRDHSGYWAQYDPMTLASPQGFRQDPELVLAWYEHRLAQVRKSKPNAGHKSIVRLQKLFPKSVVITQNVDGLHQRAGSDPVWELHGSIQRQKCSQCFAVGPVVAFTHEQRCGCGGRLRPDVVWFGENLPPEIVEKAFEAAEHCDLFFTIGTSAQVYPAAQLPRIALGNGARVIEINPEPTPLSSQVDLSIREAAGSALPRLLKEFHEILA